jgi:hypothetical protein
LNLDVIEGAAGSALTITTAVSLFVHPLASVPVTMYEVVVVGLTVILAVVAPVSQL